jgi:hypothetical protein
VIFFHALIHLKNELVMILVYIFSWAMTFSHALIHLKNELAMILVYVFLHGLGFFFTLLIHLKNKLVMIHIDVFSWAPQENEKQIIYPCLRYYFGIPGK